MIPIPCAGVAAEGGAVPLWAAVKAVPDEMDLDIQLVDWLFALEGATGVQAEVAAGHREGHSWHTTFRMLRFLAKSNAPHGRGTGGSPIQDVTVSKMAEWQSGRVAD